MLGRAGKTTIGALPLAVAMCVALGSPASAIAGATIGSPLTLAPPSVTCGTDLTAISPSLASGVLKAPSDGVLVRWRLRLPTGGGSHLYRLRVLHSNGGTSVTGGSVGPAQTAPSAGVNVLTLPTPLPISAGDLVGFDCDGGAPYPVSQTPPPGSTFTSFAPTLAAGDTRSGVGPFNYEVLVNADFLSKPSSKFSFGAVTRKKRKGTATLAVDVPGPGTLALGGAGVRAQQAGGGPARPSLDAAGTVKLQIRATGKKKSKLNAKGKVKLGIAVTFTPSGGEVPGDPNTQSTTVKLIKKRP